MDMSVTVAVKFSYLCISITQTERIDLRSAVSVIFHGIILI